ncbi:hypothetical protein [Chitinophaga filiformis]|uniref:hypothetical protein n=1 Tax=Chitinophaga filiformis TaxID=104663 RepID=UPI001F35802E|nr:hypothetical protein [Chitinophaga filiformis]
MSKHPLNVTTNPHTFEQLQYSSAAVLPLPNPTVTDPPLNFTAITQEEINTGSSPRLLHGYFMFTV